MACLVTKVGQKVSQPVLAGCKGTSSLIKRPGRPSRARLALIFEDRLPGLMSYDLARSTGRKGFRYNG